MAAPRARRYAQAVFQIAAEQDSLAEWTADLAAIARAMAEADFAALLEAPQVPAAVKQDGIDTVLGGVGETARNLVRLLVANGQARLASAIRDEYERLVDAHRGIARARIVTAVRLDEGQRREIVAGLGRLVEGEIEPEWSEDPAIIGGVVARVGDRLIDGSVRSKLEALRQTLGRPAMVPGGDEAG